ncbi:OprO/OprP family phosphate-selective porin [Geoalkalibacter halelectricus]|uniref:OprO/OprP family phosphate-selective porin n=1 Tax=Geoalkalibacter halelectricus TaxID=2847045 RepID=A0ABY5ZK08_9BACT|nr:OprO/OprP family phosphate-selective porin [Geoalkalibacter halelectricus]MDO3378230.1 OprO/OprP family phosphate-selective porin [Geoalkalibacter halelectricus]UWZ79179.1 OprO/OprP family phosphate-selective porin [Geoalkalibacter halelectricus]
MKHAKSLFALILTAALAAPVAAPAADGDPAHRLEQRLAELEEALGLAQAEKEESSGIRIGGAVRVQYSYTDWDAGSRERGGDFNFDTFRLNLDGEIKDMILSAEYRFYPSDDWHAPKHAWIGYNFTDDLQGQIGVHQVPFGLLPYASHNFWFSGAYYVGLEDDYDMGIKFLYNQGPWDLALAFYKNEELGNAGNAGRYSVDVISNADGGFAGAQPAGNRETNQFNLRLAHTLDHGALGTTELGGSGQWGQLYNSGTGKTGDHWAGALHLNGNYGRWNLQLQWARYDNSPKNPEGFDNDIITMGAYSFSWGVPAKADIAIANLAYTQPVNWGPISSLTFYSDNTLIEPDKDRFNSIWQNVLGCMIAAGPVFTYVDVISGKNMIFSGGDMVGGAGNEGRTTRVNVNFGYYF